MGEIVRCFRVNVVNLNTQTKTIEPSDIFHYFHPDCYQRWLKRQIKKGVFSYSMAELDMDSDNLKMIDCHSCQMPIAREVINL